MEENRKQNTDTALESDHYNQTLLRLKWNIELANRNKEDKVRREKNLTKINAVYAYIGVPVLELVDNIKTGRCDQLIQLR